MRNNSILGIGIDIVSTDRFSKLKLIKKSRFLNRIFTKVELDYCFSHENVASKLATKFAGKEAVIKACSYIADPKVIDYKKIEIITNVTGAPKVQLHYSKMSKYKILISLSNEIDKVVSIAIVSL